MITQEQLQELQAALGAAHGGAAGDYLGVAWLMQEFSLTREAAVEQVSVAPTEFGINGFHAEPEMKNLRLYSFQWTDGRTCFQSPLQQMVDAGLERVFGEGPPGVAPDQFLMRVKNALLANQSVTERVFFELVFRGDPAVLERSMVYARLREELENKKYLIDRFFGRPVTLVFQFLSAKGGDIAAQAHQKTTHTYPLTLERCVEMSGPAGEMMRIGFAKLLDLSEMHKAMGPRFLESNIRYFLTEGTPTNRSLDRAFREIVLERKRDPLVMAFDHNGVTLYAERAEGRDGGLVLTEPRMLNGAQTMESFRRFLEANPTAVTERADILAELKVPCKIITDARSDFVLNVTINNNRQNPVKPWNLHSNDLIQLELQDKFREELGIYYERQEKAFASLTEEEREEMEAGEQVKALEMVKLAQTFLAVDGELERMSRLGEMFEAEDEYRQVFSPRRLKADARKMVLCYKIQLRLSRLIREILEKGERKYAPLRRGKNLVWALLCQAVLNDKAVDEHAAAFGKKLAVETGFTRLLADLASTRVRFLASYLLEHPDYAPKVEKESFGFLRTRKAYDACMKRAEGEWGWEGKGLP